MDAGLRLHVHGEYLNPQSSCLTVYDINGNVNIAHIY